MNNVRRLLAKEFYGFITKLTKQHKAFLHMPIGPVPGAHARGGRACLYTARAPPRSRACAYAGSKIKSHFNTVSRRRSCPCNARYSARASRTCSRRAVSSALSRGRAPSAPPPRRATLLNNASFRISWGPHDRGDAKRGAGAAGKEGERGGARDNHYHYCRHACIHIHIYTCSYTRTSYMHSYVRTCIHT